MGIHMLATYQIDLRLALCSCKVEQPSLGFFKQTIVATSTNHSEIIALYEASHECIWFRRMINHIMQSCGIGALETPTIIFEDNLACVKIRLY